MGKGGFPRPPGVRDNCGSEEGEADDGVVEGGLACMAFPLRDIMETNLPTLEIGFGRRKRGATSEGEGEEEAS